MSSDAVSDTSAGAVLGNLRAAMRVDEETSGDGREVRAEITSNARTRADAGKPADAVVDACAGTGRDNYVAASCLVTAEIETDVSIRTAIEDATTTLDAMQIGKYPEDVRMGDLDPVLIRAGARSEMSLTPNAQSAARLREDCCSLPRADAQDVPSPLGSRSARGAESCTASARSSRARRAWVGCGAPSAG